VKKVSSSELQAEGLSYLLPLKHLGEHVAQHRGMTNAYLNGDKNFKDKIMAKRQQVNQDYTELLALDKILAKKFGLSDQVTQLEQRWKTLSKESFSMQAKASFTAHSMLIKDILTHMKTVADATNLSTESALDLHYINISLIDYLPVLVETLGKTRGFGAGRAAEKLHE